MKSSITGATITDAQRAKVAYTGIGRLRQELQDVIDSDCVATCSPDVKVHLAKAMGELLSAQFATGATPTEQQFADAARSLAEVTFGPNSTEGTVGIGKDRLHVYVFGKSFRKRQVANWNGIPVTWHLGAGRPNTSRTPALTK